MVASLLIVSKGANGVRSVKLEACSLQLASTQKDTFSSLRFFWRRREGERVGFFFSLLEFPFVSYYEPCMIIRNLKRTDL